MAASGRSRRDAGCPLGRQGAPGATHTPRCLVSERGTPGCFSPVAAAAGPERAAADQSVQTAPGLGGGSVVACGLWERGRGASVNLQSAATGSVLARSSRCTGPGGRDLPVALVVSPLLTWRAAGGAAWRRCCKALW